MELCIPDNDKHSTYVSTLHSSVVDDVVSQPSTASWPLGSLACLARAS